MADHPTVETLQERISRLVAERQALRARRADEDRLEENRREIAHSQHQLSQALIARHLPVQAAA
jgi:hypothetical protein